MSASPDICRDATCVSLDEVITLLRRSIAALQPGVTPELFPDDAPLLQDGFGLDSVTLIELIADLEKRLGFEFLESDLRMRTFASLRSLAQVIVLRLRARVETP
jgi:acyl carrier protein